jgi:hypothetical protein
MFFFKYYNINMKNIILTIFILLFFLILYQNYDKIPSLNVHINRNKYNIFPVGHLIHVKDDKYIDQNNIIWIKRGVFTSLLHNPFKNYVFETYDVKKQGSSEVKILKTDFDNGYQNFKPTSFNYYSSFNSPLSHFFADVLPIIIYLRPNYKIYN